MRADQIIELLRIKHREDVFVPECKDGPSQYADHLRMDVWTMKRSWQHPCCAAYEIKVSRSDFLGDDKWQGYLPYCNLFSFVCPWQVISVGELPSDVGLFWVSKTGGRLFTKRKAVYRDVEIPQELLRYLLMARTVVQNEWQKPTDRRAYWSEWLENREVNREFGWKVSKAIRVSIDDKIHEVERENQRLRDENKQLAEVKHACELLGIDRDRIWRAEKSVRDALAKANGADLVRTLRGAMNSLGEIIRAVEAVSASTPEPEP